MNATEYILSAIMIAMNKSMIAKDEGTYETYEGSTTSQGILQYDMLKLKPKFPLLNSMPTALTAQIHSWK